jgi:hypothetical protein
MMESGSAPPVLVPKKVGAPLALLQVKPNRTWNGG